jgi:hypothetical protein
MASDPVKTPDQKTVNSSSNVVNAPAPKGPEYPKYFVKAPEDNTGRPVLRGPGPANDLCANAQLVTLPSTVAGTTIGAAQDPEGAVTCITAAGAASPGVWYTFAGTGNPTRIETCGLAGWDTVLRVFSGSCGGLTCVTGNDDNCGLQSGVNFTAAAGTTYYVYLSAYGAATVGDFSLNFIDLGAPPPGPANDECAGALPLPCNSSIIADNTNATVGVNDQPSACRFGGGFGAGTIYYTFTPSETSARIQTCNSAFPADDSIIEVFSGCGGFSIACSEDDCTGLLSRIDLTNLVVGQQYIVQISAYSDLDRGAYTVDVTCPLPPMQPGDGCATALPFGAVPGAVSGDTTIFQPDTGVPACGVGGASNTVWYSVTGTGNNMLASTCTGTAYDSALAVFTGDCSFLTCVASNDDACGLQSTVVFPTTAGQTYYVQVGGFATSFGAFNLEISELLPPGNDDCVNSTLLGCNSTATADNLGATDNFVDDIYLCRVFGGNGSGSVWFRFVASDDSAVVQTCNSFFPADDSILQVFSGACGALSPLPDGCNDDGCTGLLSRVIVRNLTVGQTYYVMLSGWSAADAGAYSLDLICPAPPPAPGDDCAAALDFGAVPGTINGDTSTANPDGVDTCGGAGAAAPGVFYLVTAPAGATRLRAETCGSGYDTVIRAYNGPCEALTCIVQNDDRCGLQSSIQWDVVGGQQYIVYVGGFGNSSGAFTLTIDEPPPPCQVDASGTTPEGEDNCGIPDTFNGGCNSVPAIFGTITCNQPILGTAAFDGFTRDTDWFHFTLNEPGEVTLTVQAEFAALIGFLATTTPNPTGDCSEYTGFVDPFAFPNGDCTAVTVTATLGAGVWTAFVAPQFTDTFVCGASNDQYRAVLTGACGTTEADCNNNGINDPVEIAGGARDCFNPLTIAVPGTTGGSDTFLDECQCVANFNRDGTVNSGDISSYLTSWLNAVGGGVADADVNCDNANNSGDISAFLTVWLSAVQNTIPHDGCP